MWTPNESQLELLAEMTPQRQLFIQRWVEMFDPNVDFRWRLRPLSRQLLQAEADAIQTSAKGKRLLNGSVFYAKLVNQEWRSIRKTMFRRWRAAQIERDPLGSAERLGHGLSLAGFSNYTLLQTRDVWFNGANLQDQLDQVLEWYSPRTLPRQFRLVIPVRRRGTVPASTGMRIVGYNTLGDDFRSAVDAAIAAGEMESAKYFLTKSMPGIDADAVAVLFRENFDRYLIRLHRGMSPVRLAKAPIFVHDEYPLPTGLLIRIPHPAKYRYQAPESIASAHLGRIADAAKADPVIDIILDQYLIASRAIANRSAPEAFQVIFPLLDVGFDCTTGPWFDWAPFARTIELGAALLASSFGCSLFSYLTSYLRQRCWINERAGITGRNSDAFRAITTNRLWKRIQDGYTWNPLLSVRQKTFINMRVLPSRYLQDAYTVARWDIARAVRARHALAHRGQPLTDSYLLAVVLAVAYQCLLARCSAVEAGVKFEDLISQVHTEVLSGELQLGSKELILQGTWRLAQELQSVSHAP